MAIDLSLKLITYNRAPKLARTLEFIASTALRELPLEVLDNASSDETAAVLEGFQPRLPHLSVYRHARNIGVYSNILRAYERFTTRYCWVLCDDDHYDAAGIEELLKLVEQGAHDLFLVGGPEKNTGHVGFVGTTLELQARGACLYQTFSFLPAVIFDRKFLDHPVLMRCYKAASTAWPHCPLLETIIEANARIAALRTLIVTRFEADDVGNLKVSSFYEVARSGYYVKAEHRERFFTDLLLFNRKGYAYFLRLLAAEKFQGNMNSWQALMIVDMLRTMPFRYRLAARLVFGMPRWLFLLAGRLVNKRPRTGTIPLELSERM